MSQQHTLFCPEYPTLLSETLAQKVNRLEAFETPTWAVQAIIDSHWVFEENRTYFDPCYGRGAIAETVRKNFPNAKIAMGDIELWSNHPDLQHGDFLSPDSDDWLSKFRDEDGDLFADVVCVMNPPFSKACEFVDRAFELGCAQVFCFQRLAWAESQGRMQWWGLSELEAIHLLVSRATCWRFDIDQSQMKNGGTTAYAWFHFSINQSYHAPFFHWINRGQKNEP